MNTKTVAWKFLPVLLILSLLLLFVSAVQAASSGFRSPTAQAAVTGATNGDGNGFEQNPTNAFTNGSGSAVSNNNANGGSNDTDRHIYSGYGFDIPTGATIQGIEVRADWFLDSTFGTNSLSVDLSWNNGANWTTLKTDTQETTSEHTVILGAANDTWGRTWSATEFDDGNFLVRVHARSTDNQRDISLDWIAVQVTYNQQPNAPTNSTPANGATINTPDPTFTWSAFSDPDNPAAGDTQSQFQIQLRQNPGGYPFRESIVNSNANTYTPSGWNLPDGGYCWHVRVSDDSGASNATSPYSTETCFTVNTAGSIGDLVWLDSDGDGTRDGGEPGIDGVTLTLRRGATVVGTATTAGGGAYLFNNVPGPQIQTVRDEFNTAAYTNNNGSTNWAAAWIESDSGGGGATGGSVLVTGGQLSLSDVPNSAAREVNLSGFNNATLTFNFGTSGNLENEDQIVVEASSNGGGTYAVLETFTNDGSGSRSYNLNPYISANTRIRFRIINEYTGTGEFFAVDNVQIRFEDTTFATYTVTVDPGNFTPGGPLEGFNSTSSVASPYTLVLNAGQNISSVDFGYGAFAVIGDLIYTDFNHCQFY
jgi:hypothetical protein